MLDRHKLRLFISVAQLGSISKAADAHYMTQSAMSQQLAQLEAYLGVALVHRHRRGVTLTADGERLFAYAQQIEALFTEAEASLIHLSVHSIGTVALGATPGISTYRLPHWTQGFANRYPRLMLQIQTDVTAHIVDAVTTGRLDVGLVEGEILPEQSQSLHIHPLETAEQWVVVGRGHAWWGRESLALAELDGVACAMRIHSQTRIWLDDIFKAHHIKPIIRVEMSDPEGIKGMVMQTDIIGILPDYAVRQEVAQGLLWGIAVRDVALVRYHKALWDAKRRLSPFAQAFVDHLRSHFPTLSA